MDTCFSLRQLAETVRAAVESLDRLYWVAAELAKVNIQPGSGHCYLELVEKQNDKTLAQMRATIWSRVFAGIRSSFAAETGKEFQPGMKILMLGQLTYHEVYGLSFNVIKVDPRYTLGEMARKKRETLERLAKEGILDTNKGIPFPLVPHRIAVVSSETAAGYGDFLDRLRNNPYGYGFSVTLFPATLQGEKAEDDIIRALRLCAKSAGKFDLLAIVRGGGGTVDLSTFDGYRLAREIALFPLPVLTGIGHERDETVADRTAFRRLITPTAVAETIVGAVRSFEERIEENADTLFRLVSTLFDGERRQFILMTGTLLAAVRRRFDENRHLLSTRAAAFREAAGRSVRDEGNRIGRTVLAIRAGTNAVARQAANNLDRNLLALSGNIRQLLAGRKERMETLETKVVLLDPERILSRGYSITTLNGKALKDASAADPGAIIETRLARGMLHSEVTTKKPA